VAARNKIWIITAVAIGIVSIFVILLAGTFLSSIMGPFMSSILSEIAITVIILGGAWGIHEMLVRDK